MSQKKLRFHHKFIHRLRWLIVALVVLAVVGIFSRLIHNYVLRASTEDQSILNVASIRAERGSASVELVLPANVMAWHETTIYARTNGYVVRWIVDIGAKVKKGDLLAQIATPELDEQLRQAEAQLKTAEANEEFARTSANRWRNLWKTDSVSKQETDEKISNEKATAAIVLSARANRDRLRALVTFAKVIAPFDGVIRARYTDIGRLINAGSGTVPLFDLVQTDPLRVYVKIPESYALSVTPELSAWLEFPNLAGKRYQATLLNTAKSLDPSTRTLLMQLKLDNTKHELLAGSYAAVHLKLQAKTGVVLPVNTLIFRSKGMQVATIDANHRVVFRPITIGSDFGDTVQVSAGVEPRELVVLNPPDSLFNHQQVHVLSQSSLAEFEGHVPPPRDKATS